MVTTSGSQAIPYNCLATNLPPNFSQAYGIASVQAGLPNSVHAGLHPNPIMHRMKS